MWIDDYVTVQFTDTLVAGHSEVGIYATHFGTAMLEASLWHNNGADTAGDGIILTGTVNIYGDPAFIDPTTRNYHLGFGSAAIDAGWMQVSP